jgi:hypothetical protein
VLEVTSRSPAVTINHFACNGAFVYRMFSYLGRYESGFLGIKDNPLNIKQVPILPAVRPLLTKFLSYTMDQTKGWSWIIWRSPFWMFLLISGCVCSCFKHKKWFSLLILVPGLLIALPMVFLSLGQIFRYVYSVYLCGILFSGYFWTKAVSDGGSEV